MRKSLCTNLLRGKNERQKQLPHLYLADTDTDTRRNGAWHSGGAVANCGTFCKFNADKAKCLPKNEKKKIARKKPASSYRTQQRRQWRRQLRRQSAPSTVVIKCCPSQLPICHLKIKFRLIYKGGTLRVASSLHWGLFPRRLQWEIRMQFIIMQSRLGQVYLQWLCEPSSTSRSSLFLLGIFLLGLFPSSLFT